MPKSALWTPSNSPKISVKSDFSAGAMWASTLTNLLEEVNDFVEVNIREERSC